MTAEHRFNPAPGWPTPPLGWVPEAGWRPDDSWPAAPTGWQIRVPREPLRRRLTDFMSGLTTRRRPYVAVGPVQAMPKLTSLAPVTMRGLTSEHPGAQRGREAPARAQGVAAFDLWGQKGWYGQKVAGVSHHLRVVEEVCRGAVAPDSSEPDSVDVAVTLVPEPDHPHDRNAVSVRSSGRLIGYLPREDAQRYSPVLLQLAEQGLAGQVGARVWSGRHNDYVGETRDGQPRYESVFYASVHLDLDEPHLLLPANLPPVDAHEMLPNGHSIQVHGEQSHMDVLTRYIGSRGEQWVHVTLHEIVEQLPRSKRTVLEARIDGARIGQLSPKLSADLLPALRFLHKRGVLAVVRGRTKGNRAAVEVTLHVQRAHQLGDGWFDGVTRRHG